MSNYLHPEVLVTTDWVADHMKDPKVKLVEVDVDTTSYDKGHVAGAIGWNWQTQLCDRVRRDVVDPRSFAELCSNAGIKPEDTVIFYGDNNNWFAAWAFWQFKLHGHKDARLMNGGRKKWELEKRPAHDRARQGDEVELSHPADGRLHPRLSPRGGRGGWDKPGQPCRRALAGRVYRQDPGASGPERNLPARRAHSRRQEHSVGQVGERRWHVQKRRRTAKSSTPAAAWISISRPSRTAASASDRATPGSFCVFAWTEEREELRR